ncbi:MAG: hypothetical protein FRX49_06384 [Trebouxia sp. A1-2]|nr:MAG: hypothetical protein FRX49_06384 [Trebouxia sp. A1-2]
MRLKPLGKLPVELNAVQGCLNSSAAEAISLQLLQLTQHQPSWLKAANCKQQPGHNGRRQASRRQKNAFGVYVSTNSAVKKVISCHTRLSKPQGQEEQTRRAGRQNRQTFCALAGSTPFRPRLKVGCRSSSLRPPPMMDSPRPLSVRARLRGAAVVPNMSEAMTDSTKGMAQHDLVQGLSMHCGVHRPGVKLIKEDQLVRSAHRSTGPAADELCFILAQIQGNAARHRNYVSTVTLGKHMWRCNN